MLSPHALGGASRRNGPRAPSADFPPPSPVAARARDAFMCSAEDCTAVASPLMHILLKPRSLLLWSMLTF